MMMRFRTPMLGLACGALWTAACGEARPVEPCVGTSTGDLTVSIVGLPAGDTAFVTVSGPGGTFVLNASGTLTGLASGTYTIAAGPITVPDSLISRVFAGRAQSASVCVRDAASLTTGVLYSPQGGSGKLWYGAGFYSLGFNASQLVTTATLSPAVTVGTRGGAGVTFDREGNLWVRGQSNSDPALMRYNASTLGTSGNPVPDRIIGISGLNCLSPGSLAFDASGNLWLSLGCQGRVVRLTAAQIAASGTLLPAVQITNLVNPLGLAFDYAGNLWIADQTTLKRFDAARLEASTSAAANLSVTFTTPTPPSPGVTTLAASHLAFSPDSALWVSSYEQQALYRVEPATIALTGSQAATPTRILYLGEFTFPKGFAFDNAGGVFIGTAQSTFVRLAPAQLDVNSTPGAPTVANRTIASASILGYGDDMAIFPAPPTTPLYHRAP